MPASLTGGRHQTPGVRPLAITNLQAEVMMRIASEFASRPPSGAELQLRHEASSLSDLLQDRSAVAMSGCWATAAVKCSLRAFPGVTQSGPHRLTKREVVTATGRQ